MQAYDTWDFEAQNVVMKALARKTNKKQICRDTLRLWVRELYALLYLVIHHEMGVVLEQTRGKTFEFIDRRLELLWARQRRRVPRAPYTTFLSRQHRGLGNLSVAERADCAAAMTKVDVQLDASIQLVHVSGFYVRSRRVQLYDFIDVGRRVDDAIVARDLFRIVCITLARTVNADDDDIRASFSFLVIRAELLTPMVDALVPNLYRLSSSALRHTHTFCIGDSVRSELHVG